MKPKRDELFEAYQNLLNVRHECSCEISKSCAASELTVRQIEYLKLIDSHDEMTFSRLAEITKNSKPTITEMINKFISLHCVFKEKSKTDGRVSFIHLTDEGRQIARHEISTMYMVVDRFLASLDKSEIDLLISLFKKVR